MYDENPEIFVSRATTCLDLPQKSKLSGEITADGHPNLVIL